jgi:hypothetical protein
MPLSLIATAYRQNADTDFIADKVFPNIPVDKQTDFYYRFSSASYLRTDAQKRAPSTETVGVEWTFTKDTYAADVWGLHNDIEDQFRANADDNFQLDRAGTELITQQMLLRRELEWINAFFKTGIWSQDNAGVASAPTGTQFLQFDQSGSTPMGVFRSAAIRFQLRTGLRPNTAVFGPEVWNALMDHPQIVDRIKYTQGGFLTEQLVARALGIDNILVANAVQTAAADISTAPYPAGTFLAGKNFMLCYAAPRAARNVPSAGYTFSWNGYAGANAWGGRIKKFRMEHIAADRIEIEAAYGMKQVAPELGEFFSSAVS